MAKEKTKVNDWPVTLERVMVEIKNNGQPVVDKDNNPIKKPIFQMHLELLGKKKQFRIIAAKEDEAEMLKDFFDLQRCDELPVKIETVQFKDEISGRVNTRYNVVVRLSETDDIHVLRLTCLPSEKSSFNMAIAEKANNWICPDNIRQVRKERYEAAQKKKAEELQEQPKPSGKPSPKKGDNLLF